MNCFAVASDQWRPVPAVQVDDVELVALAWRSHVCRDLSALPGGHPDHRAWRAL
jgi:hypothetical protein